MNCLSVIGHFVGLGLKELNVVQNKQKSISDPVKHGTFNEHSEWLLAVNYFRKNVHRRCLTGS